MNPILANAGVPMIFLALPPMTFLIIPVIVIEFLVSRSLLWKEVTFRKWVGLGLANALSTFIGWPIAWLALVIIQITAGGGRAYGYDSPLGAILAVTLQAPWLIPYESQFYWMIPAAMCTLLIPFFFVSVYIERFILGWMWKKEDYSTVTRFSWIAHLYSYGFLFVVVFICGAYLIVSK